MKSWKSLLTLGAVLSLLLFWPIPASAQNWARTYGGPGEDGYRGVGERTADGGFVLTSRSSSFASVGDRSFWIVKLNALGQIEWQKAYGPRTSPSTQSVGPVVIHQALDRGYIVSGSIARGSAAGDLFLLRLNEGGSVRWARAYGRADRQEGQHERANIVELPDGGFAIVAGVSTLPYGSDIWILRVDANGNVLWEKTYNGSLGWPSNDSAPDILYTPDGTLLVGGATTSLSPHNDLLLLKLDLTDGHILSQKVYVGPRDHYPSAGIRLTPDGGVAIAGVSRQDVQGPGEGIVLKLDAEGNAEWAKKYWTPQSASTWITGSIELTGDGGYAVLAAGALVKLDASGSILWTKFHYWSDWAGPNWLQRLPGGGFLMVGTTNTLGTGGGYDFMATKLDANGDISPTCHLNRTKEMLSTDWIPVAATPAMLTAPYAGYAVADIPFEVGDTQAAVTEQCFGRTNLPPEANAGADQIVACGSPAGTPVTLDGSGSSDRDGDTLTYTWTGPFPEGGGTVTGDKPTVTLPLGSSTITLTVDDGNGGTATDTIEVHVNVGLGGLFAPLAALAPQGQLIPLPGKAFKRGSTLPLKLRMFCGSGPLTNADVSPPRIVGLTRFGEEIGLATIDPDSGETNDNGLLFRYAEPNWIYNLSTRDLPTGTFVILIELPDGRRFAASFVLR